MLHYYTLKFFFTGVMEVEEDSDGSEWDEEEESDPSILCLFCEKCLLGDKATFKHCKEEHDFDVEYLQKLHNLDCFGYIKMINYIRRHVRTNAIYWLYSTISDRQLLFVWCSLSDECQTNARCLPDVPPDIY